jgi:hypothetical protein
MVLVQRGRSVQPYFAPHPARRAALEPLGAFIREIQAGPSADCYVTADCGAIGGGLSLVVRDVFPPSGILRIPRSGEASLWLGPAGAYTPLHYDDGNVAIAQLIGRKRIHLIPPHDYPLVAASSDGPYAEFDPERPDFKQYPLARFATVLTAEIEAGSALFVPAGWWHAVKSLTPTLSVSYASFHLPNVYPALENL